jgi:cyclase
VSARYYCIKRRKNPDFDLLTSIATEAFMPTSYGGGITSLEQIKKYFILDLKKLF